MPGCPLPPLKDTEAQSNTTAVFSVDPDTEELLYGGIKLAYLHPIYSLYRIAHEQNFGVSALSWNGFNLMGDRRSIDEVRRLMFCEARMKALEERLNAKS
jgi:hypothetical protein